MINSRFVVQASHLWTSFFQFFTCFSLFTAETVVTVEELVVNTKLSPPNSHFKAALLTDYTTATASSSMTRSCLSFWRKRFFDGFEKEKVNGCSLVQGKTGCAGEKGLGFLCRWRGWCLLKKGFLPLIENHDALQGVKDQFTVCSWAGKRPTCRSIIWIYEHNKSLPSIRTAAQ
jgi:hypothetical protein